MGLLKVLGIGLATVASLGAIGGITAAIVNKQSSEVTLNTLENKKEDDSKNNQLQNDKQEDTKKADESSNINVQNDEANMVNNSNASTHSEQNTGPSLKDEKPKSTTPKTKEEINKNFGECASAKAQEKKKQGFSKEGEIPIHCQIL